MPAAGSESGPGESALKRKTAGSIKWNTIDRLSTQILYAVTGIVLANLLSKEDYGLVGALLVFQAFGILFVDSGFGSALLQKKTPTERDWCTVFWFNLAVSGAVYAILFLCAPLIADIFQGNRELIPLSKVMFLTFVLNGLGLVQSTRLIKAMSVKRLAVANIISLIASGGVGIGLALGGFGAWALVWQAVTQSGVRTLWLWLTGKWVPRYGFCIDSLKSIWRVGLSVFSSSALNTFFLYIYSFVIGAFYNLASLGVYTQADKWSKMGSASISQILTASFVPLLAGVQDDPENFRRYVSRINRFTGFIAFPALIGLAVVGAPLFHTLFGNKWDAAIILFQILSVRGFFVVLISLISNYLLSLGYARRIFMLELVKDLMIFVAIMATVWFGSIEMLVWGQFFASLLTYVFALIILRRATGIRIRRMLGDLLPSAGMAVAMCAAALAVMPLSGIAAVQLVAAIAAGLLAYLLCAKLFRVPELKEVSKALSRKIK